MWRDHPSVKETRQHKAGSIGTHPNTPCFVLPCLFGVCVWGGESEGGEGGGQKLKKGGRQ